MTADIELLPLPEHTEAGEFTFDAHVFEHMDMVSYARANMEPLISENERLRAERDSFQRVGIAAQARADRLEAEVEAVWAAMPRDARYLDPPDGGCVPLHEQVRRMAADATRAERLTEALRLIESAKDRGFGIDYARGVAQSALRDHDQEVGNG